MNEEKKLLVEFCKANPILRTVVKALCCALESSQSSGQLPITEIARASGLNQDQVKVAFDWLVRKDFLDVKRPLANKSARYLLDTELRTEFSSVRLEPFGVVGETILSSLSSADEWQVRDATYDDVIYTLNNRFVGNQYGVPLTLSEALFLHHAIARHIDEANAMGEDKFDLHRRCAESLSSWRHLLQMSNSRGNITLDADCTCSECVKKKQKLLVVRTNHRSYMKQERASIRNAMAQLR